MLSDAERDETVAREILAGRCPFGRLKEGDSMAHCPLGFPGCGCADEWNSNEHLWPHLPVLELSHLEVAEEDGDPFKERTNDTPR